VIAPYPNEAISNNTMTVSHKEMAKHHHCPVRRIKLPRHPNSFTFLFHLLAFLANFNKRFKLDMVIPPPLAVLTWVFRDS
jgi:hypothetical protein